MHDRKNRKPQLTAPSGIPHRQDSLRVSGRPRLSALRINRASALSSFVSSVPIQMIGALLASAFDIP